MAPDEPLAGLSPKLVDLRWSEDLGADRIALLGALRQLPRSQRESLALHYLADLSVGEVARTLDVPTGTIKARLSRGRTALAALLAESDSGSPDAASQEARHV